MLRKIPNMKVQNCNTISAFGGINFVFKYLEEGNLDELFDKHFPQLANQSVYSWKDIIYSILSIYLCGGDCIEDLQLHLKTHFAKNPFVNLPSSDTVLKRLKELSDNNNPCFPKRATVEHT